MITQYKIYLQSTPGHTMAMYSAYRLYAWLLEQLPNDEACWLHERGGTAVSQYLQRDGVSNTYCWTLNLLSDQVVDFLRPVLDNAIQIQVENQELLIADRMTSTVTPEDLIYSGRSDPGPKTVFNFCSPTAFKQSGRYTIFPQERLILQSLMMRWTELFPEYALNDEDTFQIMISGLHITDYQLRSLRFQLKGVRIPGFMGKCTFEAKLSLPLLELWNTLCTFANYAGLGIKTSLGMGGISAELERRNRIT